MIRKELITPDRARALLGTSPGNRPISHRLMVVFASAMTRGEWRLVGSPIVIDTNSRLRDGHHRLLALVEAGVSVEFHVQYGVASEDIDPIDTGRHRSLGDRVKLLRPNTEHPQRRASLLSACARLLTGTPVIIVSLADHDRWCGLFKGGIEWALDLALRRSAFTVASITGALAFAHRANAGKVEEFGEKLFEQTGLVRGEPAWLLARSMSAPGAVRNGIIVSRRVLRAVQAELNHERLEKIHDSTAAIDYFRSFYRGAAVDDVLAPWRAIQAKAQSARVADATRGTPQRILAILNGKSMAIADITSKLSGPVKTTTVRTTISRMISAGMLRKSGNRAVCVGDASVRGIWRSGGAR